MPSGLIIEPLHSADNKTNKGWLNWDSTIKKFTATYMVGHGCNKLKRAKKSAEDEDCTKKTQRESQPMWMDANVHEQNIISVISICWSADVGHSCSHTVRRSSQISGIVRILLQAIFGRKTVTRAILAAVSECDVGPPFNSQDQRSHSVSLFCLGLPKNQRVQPA